MGEKRIADYFVIAGVPNQPRAFDRTLPPCLDPITDIAVIIRSENEPIPPGFVCIEKTPGGHKADLNHGSIRSPSVFLCVKRGHHRPPITDIGVFYDEGKEKLIDTCRVIRKTPSGFSANVNNSGTQTYITYLRSSENAPPNQLVVTDICVILANKNESPPHAYLLIDKNLNKGMFGSDVYLCYKKSVNRAPYLPFNPVVIDRFPLEDYPNFSLSEHLPNFCLPLGATIECWPAKTRKPYPSFSTFVLTLNSGEKVYASLLNFYEKISPDELTLEELKYLKYLDDDDDEIEICDTKTLQRIKSICIISHWPFFNQFKRFLSFLCKTFCASSFPPASSLESYIFYFMRDIPFPSPDRPNILVNLTHSSDETKLLFTQTFDDLPLPCNGASFTRLLFNLGPENCLHSLLFALTEQKILLHSLRPSALTEIAETISTMIFPFNWHCPYIPMCPLSMSAVLHAPLPFIIGIDSCYFDYYSPPNDVASIDIDTKAIYLSENKRFLNMAMMPKKEAKTLRQTLDKIYTQLREQPHKNLAKNDAEKEKFEQKSKQIETEIQEAFLYFMASILKDFRHYLKPITAAPKVGATDPSSLFDMQGFVRSREIADQPFYKLLVLSQMFTKFIEERSLVSDKNISLAFFDECIEKVEKHTKSKNKSTCCSLIDFDEQSNVKKTVYITIPDIATPSTPQEKMELVNATIALHKERSGAFFGPFSHPKFYKLTNDYSSSRNSFMNAQNHRHISAKDSEDVTDDSPELNSGLQTYMFARRAKHEIRKAAKIAQQATNSPVEWAKNLLVNAYSLWFTHFPAFSHVLLREATTRPRVDESTSKPTNNKHAKPLSVAYQVLQRMQTMSISTPDEFCYRILMILCGIHSQPALAVKVFLDMKKHQVRLNAITYGYYNKAVLEGNWPLEHRDDKWAKLRNTCRVVFHFKRHIKCSENNRHALNEKANSTIEIDKLRKPLDANDNDFLKQNQTLDYSEAAGLLINSQLIVCSPSNGLPPEKSCRRRSKSSDSRPVNVTVNGDEWITRLVNGRIASGNAPEADSTSNLESSKSDIHPETASEASTKDGSEEDLNDTFSSRFATPIKNFFSPEGQVGNTLRQSLRLAKNLTKSKYGFSRNPTFHNSDKTLNTGNSLSNNGDEVVNGSKGPLDAMPRSSTMPQSFVADSTDSTSTPTKSSKSQTNALNSPWSYKLSSVKHSEYVFSTFKSAANRINELKSSFSSTSNANSPVRLNMANVVASSNYLISQLKGWNFTSDNEDGTMPESTIDDNSNHVTELKDGLDIIAEHRTLFAALRQHYSSQIETPNTDAAPRPIVFRVEMSSCSICRICNSIIFDEEIMCKWGADDSNLNTNCIYCNNSFVPSLTISIKDFRNEDNQIDGNTFKTLEPIAVPYLSPLVLRKELESILNSEGYASLIRCKFVDDHPIVYWNLLWYFTRLNLPSHISSLALLARSINSSNIIVINEKFDYDFRNVDVVCLWDNEKLYQNTPLHRRWLKLKNRNKSDLTAEPAADPAIYLQLIECIELQNASTPIKYLISERSAEKTKATTGSGVRRFNSIYRELLFLTLIEIGDQMISDTFDLQYCEAFESLMVKDKEALDIIDNPPSIGAIFCRNLFRQLSLQ